MANVTPIKNSVDADTVQLLEEALEAAKEGKVSGAFMVLMYCDSGYARQLSDSMHNYAGRGMVMSAVMEEMVNNVTDHDGPKIGKD